MFTLKIDNILGEHLGAIVAPKLLSEAVLGPSLMKVFGPSASSGYLGWISFGISVLKNPGDQFALVSHCFAPNCGYLNLR